MENGAAIEKWLADTLGLDTAAIGQSSVERVIAAGVSHSGVADAEAYLERLSTSTGEAEWCLEELLVPETWFFRDREPFVLLKKYLQEQWIPAHPGRMLRVLSAPCSTGEEPYSIAMTLLEAGIPPDRARLDAVDVSRKALAAARAAVYGRSSFREPLSDRQDDFFHTTPKGRRLAGAVTGLVRFHRDNLVTPGFLGAEVPYDIIFCRNIFIYLNTAARQRLLANIDRLLFPEGLLFTGHSEVGFLLQQGYKAIRHARAFACRRAEKPAPAASPINLKSRRPSPVTAPMSLPARNPAAAADIPAPIPAEARPPAAGDPLHAEALALADRGRFDEAAELCRQHLREGRPHADVYCLLGLIHEAARQLQEAEACYLKALYLDPGHYESLIQASLLYRRQGNDRKALLYSRRAEAQERRPDGTDRP